MNQNDIPVLNKSYELYKLFHEYRKVVPKQDRFTIYERSENVILNIIELLLEVFAEPDKPHPRQETTVPFETQPVAQSADIHSQQASAQSAIKRPVP